MTFIYLFLVLFPSIPIPSVLRDRAFLRIVCYSDVRTLLEIDDDRETKETERTRESATRAIHYVTLVKLAHQQRVSSIFFAWSKEDEHSELLNYRRDHNASFLPLLSLHTYSLCVALLSYNAIYTVVVKVRIMSLRFYCFYPPPPLARDCDQVTSCSP